MSKNQPLSEYWVKRSLNSVWHPCTQMKHHERYPLIALSHGKGTWLFDHDGHKYLDAISSWWVNLFGHANPKINAALKDQLEKLEHAMLAGFTHQPVVELSERLSALTDHQLGHVFYASDGASAIEIALKMSFHYWRNTGHPEKKEFICLKNSYHGETLGALSVTDVALFKDAYGPLTRQAHIVKSPDLRTGENATILAIASLEALLKEHSKKIAALIVEPLVQCASGMAMHHPDYLRQASALCKAYNIHLIADEIAVGCGRTGSFFAVEQAGIWPDFIALSKGISGGYLPLSLVMTRQHIYDAFYDEEMSRAFLHSHSYTGNALACRAALATLDIFENENIIIQNKVLGSKIDVAFAWTKKDENLEQIRRCGTIFAFDIKEDCLPPNFSRTFFKLALEQEILVRPIGKTVYIMPPYIITDTELQILSNAIRKTLEQVLTKTA